jgi:hypothetical protein
MSGYEILACLTLSCHPRQPVFLFLMVENRESVPHGDYYKFYTPFPWLPDR